MKALLYDSIRRQREPGDFDQTASEPREAGPVQWEAKRYTFLCFIEFIVREQAEFYCIDKAMLLS